MPPCRAIAMASGASVTVSIAADTIGMFSWIFGVSARCGADLVGQHVGLGRQQQDVVEREPFLGELRRVAGAIGSLTARRRAFAITGEGAGRGLHGESVVRPPAASTGARRAGRRRDPRRRGGGGSTRCGSGAGRWRPARGWTCARGTPPRGPGAGAARAGSIRTRGATAWRMVDAHRLRSLGGGARRRRTGTRRAGRAGPSRAAPRGPRLVDRRRARPPPGSSPHSASTAASCAPSVPPGPVSTMWHSRHAVAEVDVELGHVLGAERGAEGLRPWVQRIDRQVQEARVGDAAEREAGRAEEALDGRVVVERAGVAPDHGGPAVGHAAGVLDPRHEHRVVGDRAVVVRGGDDHEADGVVALAHDPDVVGGLVEEPDRARATRCARSSGAKPCRDGLGGPPRGAGRRRSGPSGPSRRPTASPGCGASPRGRARGSRRPRPLGRARRWRADGERPGRGPGARRRSPSEGRRRSTRAA